MLDHVTIPVKHLDASMTFYSSVLGTIGYELLYSDVDVAGYGVDSWVFGIEQVPGEVTPLHIAFKAESESMVNAFYTAALAVGGIDNGAPGLRAEYGKRYYAAFVSDLSGHNIEAVFRG